MSKALLQVASRVSLALLSALLLGLISGHFAAAFVLVLAPYLGVQIWNLVRLEHWLRRRQADPPPDIGGPWGEVIAIISRLYRRKQFHKARVVQLLREFRRLTTAMPDGAILLGPDNEILWFNNRVARWLDLKRKRDFGMRIENLVRQPAFIDYLRADPSDSGIVVQRAMHPDLWLSFHLVQTSANTRKLLVVRDVTREVRLESMRKDFVANASHELRSPLTVISGYLDALADDQSLDATWHAPVQEMRRQAERMNLILSDLLELSKLESNTTSQQDQIIDVCELLAALRRDALAAERERNIEICCETDACLRGTETEVHSIVMNLLSNALKYTAHEGGIELRWSADNEGARVTVKDTGLGIAPEHIPRLTERFYRVDSGRARDSGGSGLGLAIVKHALQRHQGWLDIQSQEGKGSVFTCHFPPERVVPRSEIETYTTLASHS